MNNGFLLVIDGIDGSGKTTQIELLKKYLTDKNIPYEVISFPQYGKNEYSKQIKDYLEGKLGKLEDVDPYFIAKAYANDRLTTKNLINGWLNVGKLVIANRYVSASKAHLGANLPLEKREEFINWVDELEYETNNMPREDLTILLMVDPKLGQDNVESKYGAEGRPALDIHEQDLTHLEEANKIYLELSQKAQNWSVVNCMSNGQIRSKEEIYQQIMQLFSTIYKI